MRRKKCRDKVDLASRELSNSAMVPKNNAKICFELMEDPATGSQPFSTDYGGFKFILILISKDQRYNMNNLMLHPHRLLEAAGPSYQVWSTPEVTVTSSYLVKLPSHEAWAESAAWQTPQVPEPRREEEPRQIPRRERWWSENYQTIRHISYELQSGWFFC